MNTLSRIWHSAPALLLCAVSIVLFLPETSPSSSAETKATVCSTDGAAGAPTGSAQHPALLLNMVKRPPCRVAAVDYRVGYPSGFTLRDPAAAHWQGPLSYDSSRHILRCDNGANLAVRGFDFSLHGGIGIYDASCSNLTIQDNKFAVGPNCTISINQSAAASGITVQRNIVDGGGYVPGCATDPIGESILLGGSGSKVVEYNWLRNAAQHFLTLAGSGATARVRYNLIERCGFFQGNHCNGLQFVGGSWLAPIVSYNTFVSEQPDEKLRGKQTANFTAGSNVVMSGSRYGLVTLDHTYAASLGAGMSVVSAYLPPGTAIASVSNTGGPCCSTSTPVVTTMTLSQKAIKTGSTSFGVPNAYPSGLVNPIQVEAQLHATIRNAQIHSNVVVAAPGPVKTVSYTISLDSDDSGLNAGASVVGNYIDSRGAYGAFYPAECGRGRHCYGATFSGNIDMATGAEIRPPGRS